MGVWGSGFSRFRAFRGPGFEVQGLGFLVRDGGLGFGFFEVRGFWCGVSGFRAFRSPRFEIRGLGFRVRDGGLGLGFFEVEVSGSGFRDSGF